MDRPFSFRRTFERPFDDLLHILRDEPGVLLGLAREAALDLAAVTSAEGVHVITPSSTPATEHDVDVVLGPMQMVDRRSAMVPIDWVSVEGVRWFPKVSGELEVIQLDGRRPWCEMTFFGVYQPRFGALGAIVDAAATHWAVEQSLEAFFDAACDHLIATLELEAERADG